MATFGNINEYAYPGSYAYREGQTFYATLNEAGTITGLSLRCAKSSATDTAIKLAIYDDDGGYPGNLLGYTDEISVTNSTPEWKYADLNAPTPAAAGLYHLLLTVTGAGGLSTYFDGGAYTYYGWYGYKYTPFADPLPSWWDEYGLNIGFYATYTATPSGISIPVAMHHYRSMRG